MRGFNKRFLVCTLVVALLFSQSGLSSITAQAAKKKVVKATSIKLNYKAYTLKKGAKVKLKATIAPKKSTQKKVTWTSSDKKVATISSKGVVTGKKYGKTTITATVKGTKKKITCKIHVVKTVKVSSVSLSLPSVNLTAGQVYKVKATVNPSNASNKKLTWTSSNPAVATVANGSITALTTGTTTITVTTKSGKKTATTTVSVTNPVKGLAVTPATKEFLVGEEFQLSATITPANADNLAVTWSSSDVSIATVTSGLVKALRPGMVTISAISADGTIVGTCAAHILTSLNVMDIQGFSDGDNILTRMSTYHLALPQIYLYGNNSSLGSNFTVKVAAGVTYEVASIDGSNKIITLHYKGQVKIYELYYYCTSTDPEYTSPLITGISDGSNLLTYYEISHSSTDQTTGTIYLTGMNPSLSSSLAITVKPGVSYSIIDDPRGVAYDNKVLILTKDNITYSYTIYYTRNKSKVEILSATDGTNVITNFSCNYDSFYLYGINPTLSANFSIQVPEGGNFSIAEDPDKICDKIITVTYGDMKAIYYMYYLFDTRKTQLLSVSDEGNTSFSFNISDNTSIGYVTAIGTNSTLSTNFTAKVEEGCSCQIVDDATRMYDKIILVTKGTIQRKYFVTYTQK